MGLILAGWGAFWPFDGFPGRISTPSGARRGAQAAVRPRRGRPGPIGTRRGDLCAAAGSVGRQGGICRSAGGGWGRRGRGSHGARGGSAPRVLALGSQRPHAGAGGPHATAEARRGSLGLHQGGLYPLVAALG
jgi:hypothetical protein